MKSAGKARSNGLYRHIRTSKEIIRNLLNDYNKYLLPTASKPLIYLRFLKSYNYTRTTFPGKTA